MRDRRFGVELEFLSNGLGNLGIGNRLVSEGLQDWTGDVWYDNYSGESYYEKISHDGSELELRSPILKGKKGFDKLRSVVNILNDMGCTTTSSDGLHVHHDAPEFIDNKPLLVKLLKSWETNQEHIGKFIAPTRINRQYSPCPKIQKDAIVRFEATNFSSVRIGIANNLPRGNLNLQSLYEHGSIEFRYHEGTLDWDEIESWIRFGQSFLNGVLSRKNPIKKVDSPIVLMNRLKTNNEAHVNLIRKAYKNGYTLHELGAINA